MEVPKSLIARPDGKSQILRLSAKVNTTKGYADLSFSSADGKDKVEHATCQVTFGNSEKCLAEWERNAYLIQSRIDWLRDAEKQGNAHKIGRGLAYKLFAALVDYDKKYRGMEEVILHSENMEATSKVVFQTAEKDGNFMCSPYWIDSVAHISGFIVNGSDATNSQESVYISHGWESLQIAEPFSQDKTYRSYVRMQPRPGKIMAGDVWVFDGDRIVAVVGSLKFQCIPRKVLNMLLPPVGAAAAASQPPRAKQSLPVASSTKQCQPSKKATAQVSMDNIITVNKKLISITSQALDILATEIGVGIEELVDNIAFTDLGCDSLMSLTVSGRMRDELEIDIHSHEFQDYPTIGEFKNFLLKFEGKSRTDSYSSESTSTDSPLHDTATDTEEESKATTPLEDDMSVRSKGSGAGITEIIRATIASEMGFEIQEISDSTDLAELGMDSLMALSVLSALREKTEMTLPADLLTVNSSIREIEIALDIRPSPKSTPPISRKQSEIDIPKPIEQSIAKPIRHATSVLLQGSSRRARRHLWMIPDGGGSATSYVDIPDILPDLAVWGLNSPFMKTPEEYNVGVIGMASSFITEIKRRQPSGPYLLAGWSAGGVIAFEAVNQLTKNGDEVEQLILIDSPCPDIIEPLPSSLHQWFGSIGLLGDGDLSKLPSWLLPHFAASVNALSSYTPEKIEPSKCPMVTTIWCEDGVCKLPTDPRPDPFPYGHAQFLLDNRTDFGPNLWDKYLNLEKMQCHHMPGNHFSMMKGDYVRSCPL
jgi:iron transport multicopper oxidase